MHTHTEREIDCFIKKFACKRSKSIVPSVKCQYLNPKNLVQLNLPHTAITTTAPQCIFTIKLLAKSSCRTYWISTKWREWREKKKNDDENWIITTNIMWAVMICNFAHQSVYNLCRSAWLSSHWTRFLIFGFSVCGGKFAISDARHQTRCHTRSRA